MSNTRATDTRALDCISNELPTCDSPGPVLSEAPMRSRRRAAQKWLQGLLCTLGLCLAFGAPAAQDAALEASVGQLRLSIGRWDVVTEFLNPDGTVARSVEGVYEFSWVVPDRVVSGRSEMPDLKQVSAILFYINADQQKIEMVSVGADGRLWIMSGPLGGEVRTTPAFPTAAGGEGMLRFTRYNVAPDSFESRMEYTEDGGSNWAPANHQVFRRAAEVAK